MKHGISEEVEADDADHREEGLARTDISSIEVVYIYIYLNH